MGPLRTLDQLLSRAVIQRVVAMEPLRTLGQLLSRAVMQCFVAMEPLRTLDQLLLRLVDLARANQWERRSEGRECSGQFYCPESRSECEGTRQTNLVHVCRSRATGPRIGKAGFDFDVRTYREASQLRGFSSWVFHITQF